MVDSLHDNRPLDPTWSWLLMVGCCWVTNFNTPDFHLLCGLSTYPLHMQPLQLLRFLCHCLVNRHMQIDTTHICSQIQESHCNNLETTFVIRPVQRKVERPFLKLNWRLKLVNGVG